MTVHSEPIFGITLGWLFIALLWLPFCVWLLRRISRRIGPGPKQWVLLPSLGLVLVSIPVADDFYIQWHFNRLCRDAGLHYEKKLVVDGYYDDTGFLLDSVGEISDPERIRVLNARRFRLLESKAANHPGKHVRYEKADGKWMVSIVDQAKARYSYKIAANYRAVGYHVKQFELVLVDSSSNEVVARQSDYWRYPGWLDGLWLRFFDSAGRRCSQSRTPPLLSVLEPAL